MNQNEWRNFMVKLLNEPSTKKKKGRPFASDKWALERTELQKVITKLNAEIDNLQKRLKSYNANYSALYTQCETYKKQVENSKVLISQGFTREFLYKEFIDNLLKKIREME